MIVKPKTDQELFLEFVRMDFGTFLAAVFYLLEPESTLVWNWHIDLIISKLEAFRRGEIRRLIINLPPRHLKSLLISVALVTYWLGHNPSTKFICASYGQDFANTLSRLRRTVMNSPLYREAFETRLARGDQSLGHFTPTAGGRCLTTSVGGAITGFGKI